MPIFTYYPIHYIVRFNYKLNSEYVTGVTEALICRKMRA